MKAEELLKKSAICDALIFSCLSHQKLRKVKTRIKFWNVNVFHNVYKKLEEASAKLKNV